jgi:hypothetical protein
MGFYFQPSSRIEDGHIVFALSATSSSGSQTGKYGELLLGGDRQLNAVRNGGAFWLEPSGEKVPLDVLAVDACGPNKPLHATAVKNEAR